MMALGSIQVYLQFLKILQNQVCVLLLAIFLNPDNSDGGTYIGRIHLPLNKTLTLTDGTSIKRVYNENYFVFHPILMKLGEIVGSTHG